MGTKYNLLSFSFLRHIRTYTTKRRLEIEMEEHLINSMESKEIKPRKHPGLMKIQTVQVPASAVKAMTVVLKVNVDRSALSEEEASNVNKWCNHQINRELRHKTYNWQPVNYDEHKALQYMVERFAPEYAVLSKIFCEIKKRQPDFHPFTLFDFGSGLGTVTWAARNLWGDTLREFFNVDSSSVMNDLANLLLRDGNEDKEMPMKGVFYRQFLPASQNIKYDLVVSAYSFLELPSAQNRLETLVNLWNKTNSYLVLVEHGTNVGFQIINEAREFILDLSKRTQTQESVPMAHVFSPCPHDQTCPRYAQDTTPCNFEVSYIPVPLLGGRDARRERFSYVVFKKGARPQDDQQWPRIVREPLVRRKHTVCRLCTAAGKLEEVVFTASKHGKMPYWCARSSNWGDMLPMDIKEANNEES
ncbi:Methyltransferase-like protein 17 [Blattella germanica]|nr:Methyltransferase-like protein 17 [Blattella germanica]